MMTPIECPICFEKKMDLINFHGKDASSFAKDRHETCLKCWTSYLAYTQNNSPRGAEHAEMERNTGVRPLTCPFCRDVVYHIDDQQKEDHPSQRDTESTCIVFYIASFLTCCFAMT